MAYIQPQTSIEFFTDLGLSQDYNDSLYFGSEAEKDAYFTNTNYRLAHVERCTYAREHRGFVRVELPMSTMIHAQYMRFKNNGFVNKWWYAFVTDVNYINNNTTEVQFELDPLMSWMGDFTLSECFVERQHSETDGIGDNIIDEPVNIGTYVTNEMTRTGHFNNWTYIVFFSPNVLGAFTQSDVNDDLGIYSGLSAVIFPDDGTAETALNVYRLVEAVFGAVQMVAYVPDDFIPLLTNVSGYDDPNVRQTAPVIYSHSMLRSDMFNGIDGYSPKNNKLYTAPYNLLCVLNSEGMENDYRIEFFEDNVTHTIDFQISASVNEKTQIRLAPYSYKGQAVNEEELMTMQDFPYAAWGSDAFAAYMAQTLSDSPVRLLASANNRISESDSSYANYSDMTRAVTIDDKEEETRITRNVDGAMEDTQAISGGSLGVSLGIQIGANIGKAILTPNNIKGGGATDVTTLMKRKDFWFLRKSINSQSAKVIDDYFTMFGYAVKSVHEPKMHVRQRFTYVKTIGCKINCMCPASDADFIEKIFNKGVRFWVNHTDIGNYSDPNPPLV